ncbi:hypothetical protein IW261DRAFT_1426673 [Armillaria novae-zelandiae]|uniref:Uncharacterized protein n=1 Tax=Armillaria novae-zelandiae TaxID=153914 RepID=A0AA39NKL5_9AGAR|nr:hypothetical protein IW261DRAFT_1426673 [Armillaria novae-zelandiae]
MPQTPLRHVQTRTTKIIATPPHPIISDATKDNGNNGQPLLCKKEQRHAESLIKRTRPSIRINLSPDLRKLTKLSSITTDETPSQTPGGNPSKCQKLSENSDRQNTPPPENEDYREQRRKTNLEHSHPMPYKFPNPCATANLPTSGEEFPYDKTTCAGKSPATLPAGSGIPFTDATFPHVFILWNHITAGFPEEIREAIAASPEKFIAAVPFRAGPKFYADNRRADLLLKMFIDGLDFPDKGKITVFFPLETKEDKKSTNRDEGHSRRSAFDKPWPLVVTGFSEDFGKFLLWYQCFATASQSVWNLVPFNPKSLAWTITAFQGNVVSNEPELIADALACIKAATWHDVAIQNLVKHITQAHGRSGNPAELTVNMTQSWRLSYIEMKNFDNDKGPIFLLTGAPITDNLDFHRAIATHIRRLKIRAATGVKTRITQAMHAHSWKSTPHGMDPQPKNSIYV